VYRLCARRVSTIVLSCHRSRPSRSVWGSRERKRRETQRANGLAPRVSISSPELRAFALRQQSSSGLKSHTPGQLTQDTPLQTPHPHRSSRRLFIYTACGVGFE
jgi:hypothetical protein